MSNLMASADDPEFYRVAFKMGYQLSDFQVIDENKISESSYDVLKNMSDIERRYYIRSKKQAMEKRQTNICDKVLQEMKKRSKGYSANKKYNYNPAVSNMLANHQNILEKKARYQERVRISKSRNINRQTPLRNTIDLGRTSPNFSHASNYSQVSRKTIQSESSSRASNMSRRSSHKDRLHIVRSKQKQIQQYKKNRYLESQNKSRQKVNKVQRERQSYSRKLKTRSQISQQAVSEKKVELRSIENQEIRNHIQSLHYKIFKHQAIKEKKLQEKVQNKVPYDGAYKKQIKQMFQQNQILKKKAQYENRMQAVQRKKQQISEEKRSQLERKAEDRKYRQLTSKKYRTHMKKEEQQRKYLILHSQEQSIEKAEINRNEQQNAKKIQMIKSRVKQEIVKSNLNSLHRKKQLDTLEQVKKYSEKVNELRQIDALKKKLTKQRVNFKGTSFNLRKSRDYSFY